MGQKASKILKYGLSLALAAVLVFFAFRTVDWTAFRLGIAQTRWAWVALFFVASVLALVFRMFRWKSLLKPVDPSVSLADVWDADNVGNLANLAIPGAGELIRCGYLSGKSARYEKVFGTIVMERAWDFLAVFVLFAAALSSNWSRFGGFFVENIWTPLSGRLSFSLWWIIALLLVICAAFVLAVFKFRNRSRFFGKLSDAFSGLVQGFASFGKMEHKWLFALWTVAIWLMYVMMSYCILKSMPALSDAGFGDALFLSAVGNIASVIPVPGGIGAYHYLIALTLSFLYGVSWDTGILNATLNHELHAVLIIVLGVISYVCISLRRRKSLDLKEK